MREIKFKAYDKEEKIMCKVDVISFSAGGCFLIGNSPTETQIRGNLILNIPPKENNGHFCKFENIILMQYIGHKDKNNEEIYEKVYKEE